MARNTVIRFTAFCLITSAAITAHSQVVQFQLETTDLSGSPIDSVVVGEKFLLRATTEHVGGYVSEENSGVFAGYLDVSYNDALASVAGDIEHGPLYRNGKSGDLSTPGLLDNIGAFVGDFATLGINDFSVTPIGLGEKLLLDIPFTADEVGALNFVGAESGSYPSHDVLVYGLNEPVSANNVDFGAADVRIVFGSAQLNVVPEPRSAVLLVGCLFGLFLRFRRTYDTTFTKTHSQDQ